MHFLLYVEYLDSSLLNTGLESGIKERAGIAALYDIGSCRWKSLPISLTRFQTSKMFQKMKSCHILQAADVAVLFC